jgi:GT2 family glycosyltransferase
MAEPIDLPQPSSPRVSVIIPAAGEPGLLRACLRSLAKNGPREIPFETIVVLNAVAAETGGAAEVTPREAPGVRFVRPGVNLGLAGAGNRGRSLARGEYLVLLHDDAEVEPGWLEALVETADRHAEAGAVGGKVLFPDGRLQNAGMILWRDGSTSPAWAGAAPPAAAFDRLRAVDYCGTSSLLVRAAAWDAAGGLDERFYPAYYVDVDLSLAIRRHGQVVLFEPRSQIRHRQGASGGGRFRVFVTLRNRRLLLEKWGKALEEHEPWEKGSAEAVERAMARAAAFAERVRREQRVSEPAARAALDPALQERRHLERELALHKAWAAELDRTLQIEVNWDVSAGRLEKVPAAELAELRARSATLEAIERGRWWRLYQRLLPFLRRLKSP